MFLIPVPVSSAPRRFNIHCRERVFETFPARLSVVSGYARDVHLEAEVPIRVPQVVNLFGMSVLGFALLMPFCGV